MVDDEPVPALCALNSFATGKSDRLVWNVSANAQDPAGCRRQDLHSAALRCHVRQAEVSSVVTVVRQAAAAEVAGGGRWVYIYVVLHVARAPDYATDRQVELRLRLRGRAAHHN